MHNNTTTRSTAAYYRFGVTLPEIPAPQQIALSSALTELLEPDEDVYTLDDGEPLEENDDAAS